MAQLSSSGLFHGNGMETGNPSSVVAAGGGVGSKWKLREDFCVVIGDRWIFSHASNLDDGHTVAHTECAKQRAVLNHPTCTVGIDDLLPSLSRKIFLRCFFFVASHTSCRQPTTDKKNVVVIFSQRLLRRTPQDPQIVGAFIQSFY